jgi:hypothetical protein
MTVAATAMMTAAGASNGARRPGETMTTPKTDAAYERFKVALADHPVMESAGIDRDPEFGRLLHEYTLEVAQARENYLRTLLEEYFCRGIRDVRLVEDRSDPLKTKFYFEIPGVTE